MISIEAAICLIIIQMKIPAQYCSPFYSPKFKSFGKIDKEFFDNSNFMNIQMEISESKIDEITNYIKQNSNGEGEYFVKGN